MDNPYAHDCLTSVCRYLCLDTHSVPHMYPYDWFPVGFIVRHYLSTLSPSEFQEHLHWYLLRGANPLHILHSHPQGLWEDFDLCLSLLMDTEDQTNFHAHREALECLITLLHLRKEPTYHTVDLWAADMTFRESEPQHFPMLKNAWHKHPRDWWLRPYANQEKP